MVTIIKRVIMLVGCDDKVDDVERGNHTDYSENGEDDNSAAADNYDDRQDHDEGKIVIIMTTMSTMILKGMMSTKIMKIMNTSENRLVIQIEQAHGALT